MSLRLPLPARSIRRPSRGRRIATILFSAIVLTVLPVRILLAATTIATWTSAWRTIDTISQPFVFLFHLPEALQRQVIGYATVADVLALLVWASISIYLLALLTVRRQG